MTTRLKLKTNSWIALIAIATVAITVSAALNIVRAQSDHDEAQPETTTPTTYAEFQYATLTGTNNTINATMVPVVTPGGTVYKNLTFQVIVATNGVITIVPGSPTVVASAITAAAGF